jgi:hypothetical protein
MIIVPLLAALTLVFLGVSTVAAGARPARPAAGRETNHGSES